MNDFDFKVIAFRSWGRIDSNLLLRKDGGHAAEENCYQLMVLDIMSSEFG